MLHKHTLHLERADSVTAALDYIVIAADEPEISVLIPPCDISGVVETVVPGLLCKLRVTVILLEETKRPALVGTDYNLTSFARLRRSSVRQNQVNVILWVRHAHTARLRLHPGESTKCHAGLSLSETLPQAYSGKLTELLIDSPVQSLTCRAAISQ